MEGLNNYQQGEKWPGFRHGRIIKWTQHLGFLTLTGMERVVGIMETI